MKAIPSLRAFSLTELLLGMAVVAIVAAVIVPKFLNIQSQANATVAQQMAAELNNTYGSWKAAGGVLTGPTANAGSVILSLLGGYNDVGSQPVSVCGGSETTGGVVTVSDPVGNASLIRATLPASTTIDPNNPSSVISAGDFTIVYDSGSDAFQVLPLNLQNTPWTQHVGGTAPWISWQSVSYVETDMDYTDTTFFSAHFVSPPVGTMPINQQYVMYACLPGVPEDSDLYNDPAPYTLWKCTLTNLGQLPNLPGEVAPRYNMQGTVSYYIVNEQ